MCGYRIGVRPEVIGDTSGSSISRVLLNAG
jgi:hypothetical protein